MKRILASLVVAVCVAGLVAPVAAQHKYVGITQCKPCHNSEKQGKQFDIWKGSKHAEAFKTLESPQAAEIAKKKGLAKPASESPECLKCHVAGVGADAALFAKSFNVKDGVQCEACHGPGSDYKAMNIMKDREKAVAAGMILGKDDPKLCTKCHNPDSPTYKEFAYQAFWTKIKHPVPAAK